VCPTQQGFGQLFRRLCTQYLSDNEALLATSFGNGLAIFAPNDLGVGYKSRAHHQFCSPSKSKKDEHFLELPWHQRAASATHQSRLFLHWTRNTVSTAKRFRSIRIGIIRDPGHAEPWIIAMSAKLGYADCWGIEPMFSDFKSRGFGLEQTHIQYPDRLAS
jgi:hypothetical protein